VKPKTNPPTPTALELEILEVIWRRGRATVREVFKDLSGNRRIAYTTVLTMMGILEQKGHLKKKAGERAYVYRPVRPRERVVSGMVAELVERLFSGSAKRLLVHLVEDPSIGPEDLAEVERLVRERRASS
jgi:BlaI family transcriptional regulator, penicillinase repressor